MIGFISPADSAGRMLSVSPDGLGAFSGFLVTRLPVNLAYLSQSELVGRLEAVKQSPFLLPGCSSFSFGDFD